MLFKYAFSICFYNKCSAVKRRENGTQLQARQKSSILGYGRRELPSIGILLFFFFLSFSQIL